MPLQLVFPHLCPMECRCDHTAQSGAPADHLEASGWVEESIPGGIGKTKEVPRFLVTGPGLVGGDHGDTARLHDLVELEGNLPGHREVLPGRDGKNEIEMRAWEQLAHGVGI